MYKKIVLSFMLIFSFALCARAQSELPIATVTAVEGAVDIVHGTQDPVYVNEKHSVYVNDRIRTKSYSKVELTFADKSIVRFAPNSCVVIQDFRLASSGKREYANFLLTRGKIEAVVSKTGNHDTFVVDTPNSKGSVKGSDIIFSYQAGQSGFFVKEGAVSVLNKALPDLKVKVAKGDCVFVNFNESPGATRPYLDAEVTRHNKDVTQAMIKKWVPSEKSAPMNAMLVSIGGTVRIFKKGASDWRDAKTGEMLSEGNRLQTGDDGRAEIRLENGNALFMEANTDLGFATMRYDVATGSYENVFGMNQGKLSGLVERINKQSTFQVRTPTVVAGARGSYFTVMVAMRPVPGAGSGVPATQGGSQATPAVPATTSETPVHAKEQTPVQGAGSGEPATQGGSQATPAVPAATSETPVHAKEQTPVQGQGSGVPATQTGSQATPAVPATTSETPIHAKEQTPVQGAGSGVPATQGGSQATPAVPATTSETPVHAKEQTPVQGAGSGEAATQGGSQATPAAVTTESPQTHHVARILTPQPMPMRESNTQVSFESGEGYVSSPLTGQSQDIASGQTVSVDSLGNVALPVNTPVEQRTVMMQTWVTAQAVDAQSGVSGQTGFAGTVQNQLPPPSPKPLDDAGNEPPLAMQATQNLDVMRNLDFVQTTREGVSTPSQDIFHENAFSTVLSASGPVASYTVALTMLNSGTWRADISNGVYSGTSGSWSATVWDGHTDYFDLSGTNFPNDSTHTYTASGSILGSLQKELTGQATLTSVQSGTSNSGSFSGTASGNWSNIP